MGELNELQASVLILPYLYHVYNACTRAEQKVCGLCITCIIDVRLFSYFHKCNKFVMVFCRYSCKMLFVESYFFIIA